MRFGKKKAKIQGGDKMATYIQVGVTAFRDENGGFLPSVPLYIRTDEAVKGSGLTETEERSLESIAEEYAVKYPEYAREKRKTNSKKKKVAEKKKNEKTRDFGKYGFPDFEEDE